MTFLAFLISVASVSRSVFAMNDPVTGRWLQRDPIGYVSGGNLYLSLKNDPVNQSDPNGTIAIELEINAFIAGSPGYWLPEPTGSGWFGTDERWFGGGSARLKAIVKLDTKDIGKQYLSDQIELSLEMPPAISRRRDCLTCPIQSMQASPHNYFGPRGVSSGGATYISGHVAAADPFWLLAPEVDIYYRWVLTTDCWTHSLMIGIEGEHNLYPEYEAMIRVNGHHENFMMYGYVSPYISIDAITGFWALTQLVEIPPWGTTSIVLHGVDLASCSCEGN